MHGKQAECPWWKGASYQRRAQQQLKPPVVRSTRAAVPRSVCARKWRGGGSQRVWRWRRWVVVCVAWPGAAMAWQRVVLLLVFVRESARHGSSVWVLSCCRCGGVVIEAWNTRTPRAPHTLSVSCPITTAAAGAAGPLPLAVPAGHVRAAGGSRDGHPARLPRVPGALCGGGAVAVGPRGRGRVRRRQGALPGGWVVLGGVGECIWVVV